MASLHVVVTGAAGFIGSHTCERLVMQGHRVTGVDSFDSYLYPADVKRSNAAELAKRFDRIILDSPPVQVVTDAVVLSKLPQTDGVILVVNAAKTPRDDIKRSARQIKAVGGNIFGVIVNAIEPDTRSGYYYSYYGYAEKTPEPSQSQG